VTKLVN